MPNDLLRRTRRRQGSSTLGNLVNHVRMAPLVAVVPAYSLHSPGPSPNASRLAVGAARGRWVHAPVWPRRFALRIFADSPHQRGRVSRLVHPGGCQGFTTVPVRWLHAQFVLPRRSACHSGGLGVSYCRTGKSERCRQTRPFKMKKTWLLFLLMLLIALAALWVASRDT